MTIQQPLLLTLRQSVTIGVVEKMNTSAEMIVFPWEMDPQPMEKSQKVLNPMGKRTLSLRNAVSDKTAVKELKHLALTPSLHNVVNRDSKSTTSQLT